VLPATTAQLAAPENEEEDDGTSSAETQQTRAGSRRHPPEERKEDRKIGIRSPRVAPLCSVSRRARNPRTAQANPE
jgi:hypothetical protein